MFQAAAEHVQRHGVALPRGYTEPGEGQFGIAGDAVTFQQDLPEHRLRFRLATAGSSEQQAGGGTRVVRAHTSTQRRSRLW